MKLLAAGSLLCFALLILPAGAAEIAVSIRADFPGGNVTVLKNEGPAVQVAPDLRGGKPWFYWHFEATASQAGRVTFIFPSAMRIGIRGPAYSLDEGQTWQWLGMEQVELAAQQESFAFDFKPEHLKVRFTVAIPYLQHNLAAFLAKHAANKHLQQPPFAKTRNGTPVELLQIGEPRPERKALIVTARHHACESMASYVMEGWLTEAMSESSAGVEFRKKYVLFAIPLVDKDGVQAGDQGKNRAPHDHNRDYGPMPLYPEIKAIQDLAEAQRVQYALDLHCPALRGDVHEAFHFLGLGVPHIKNNTDELIAWLKEERPPIAMTPLNFMVDPTKPNAVDGRINSHHFALRENSMMATTLEIPYAQPNCPLDADLARAYGRSLLRAWTRTKFLSADPAAARGLEANADLVLLRTNFLKLYRGQPVEAAALVQPYLEDKSLPAVYRVEAHNLFALLRLNEKKYADAITHYDTARTDPQATTYQQMTSAILRLQVLALDPVSTALQVEAALKDFQQLPYPANDQQAKALETVSIYYQTKQDFPTAIKLARKQLLVAAAYERGRILNRIAGLHDSLKQPDEAIAARQEAVQILRKQLAPTPQRSAFGAMMVVDLFDALGGIPTATLEEKRAAAELVLNHDIVSAAVKERMRKGLPELQK